MQPVSINSIPYLALASGRDLLAGIVTKPDGAIKGQKNSKPVDSFLSALITAIELGFVEGSKYLADYFAGTGELDVTRRLFGKALNSLSNPVYVEGNREYPRFPLPNGDTAQFLEGQDKRGNSRVYLRVKSSIVPYVDYYLTLPTSAPSIKHVRNAMVEMAQNNREIYGDELLNSTTGSDEQFNLMANSNELLEARSFSYTELQSLNLSNDGSSLAD